MANGPAPEMGYGPAAGNAETARVAPYMAPPPSNEKAALPSHGNLFVGSLPPALTDLELQTKFSQYGQVLSCKVLRDPATGTSKGCGFVQFGSAQEANIAIEAVSAEGELVVKFQEKGKGGGKGDKGDKGKGKGDQSQSAGSNLFLKGIPKICEQSSVDQIFKEAGFTVVRSRIIATAGETNMAMMQLGTAEEAASAIAKMNGQAFGGIECLIVEYAQSKTAQADQSGGWQSGGKGGDWSGGADGWNAGAGGGWNAGGKGGKEEAKKDNLFVQPVPANCDNATLTAVFEKAGFSVLRMKVLPAGARDDTAAMVQLASEEQAAQAMVKMTGQTPEGFSAPLSMNYVTNKPDKGAAKGFGKAAKGPVARATGPMTLTVRYAGQTQAPSDNLYIAGLPSPQMDEPTFKLLFTSLGCEVIRMKIVPDTRGVGSSAAMVQLQSQEVAAQIVEALHGQTFTCEELRAAAGGDMAVDSSTPPLVVKYAGATETPSDNLFISGLPSPQVNPNTLKELFAALGLNVIRTKAMPDTRGVGHSQAMVQVGSQEEAATAIAMLNGEVFPADAEGATSAGELNVRYAGSTQEPSDNLYITGLPSPAVNEQELKSVFAALGFTVMRSKVVPDTQGRGSSAAMIQVASKEEAAAAIETLNGQAVDGLSAAQAPDPWAKGGGKDAGKDAGKADWGKGGDAWGKGGGDDWNKGKGKGQGKDDMWQAVAQAMSGWGGGDQSWQGGDSWGQAAPASASGAAGGAKFCGSCGNAFQGESKFCQNCGAKRG